MSTQEPSINVHPEIAQATATIVAALFRKDPPWDPANSDDRAKITDALKEVYVGFFHAEALARKLQPNQKVGEQQ